MPILFIRSLLALLILLSVAASAEITVGRPADASGDDSVAPEIISGRVLGVVDGDTLTLLDAAKQRHQIRLAGIDAPENTQQFGPLAKSSLSAMLFGQQVVADCRKREHYLPRICVVTIRGRDVGLEQVRNGMAWVYQQQFAQQTAQERKAYEQAEFKAKIHRLGLWANKNPTPPWDWRRGRVDE